jgi:hypothetical protein
MFWLFSNRKEYPMRLIHLVERSLHTKSMQVEDGPILPPSTHKYTRQDLRRQITSVMAKSRDTFPNSASASWDVTLQYRFIKKDGNPALISGGSIVYKRRLDHEPEIRDVVKAFLDEVGINVRQVE